MVGVPDESALESVFNHQNLVLVAGGDSQALPGVCAAAGKKEEEGIKEEERLPMALGWDEKVAEIVP